MIYLSKTLLLVYRNAAKEQVFAQLFSHALDVYTQYLSATDSSSNFSAYDSVSS